MAHVNRVSMNKNFVFTVLDRTKDVVSSNWKIVDDDFALFKKLCVYKSVKLILGYEDSTDCNNVTLLLFI